MKGSPFWTITVTPSIVWSSTSTRTRTGLTRYLRLNVATAAYVKYHGPSRAFRRGWASTRSTTLASSPMPDANTKWRPLTMPVSIRRGSKPSAIRSRCSVASTTSFGMPSIRQKTFVAPPGRQVSGVSDPISPLAASFTVPSPPNETTTSYPSAAASRQRSVAWPCA